MDEQAKTFPSGWAVGRPPADAIDARGDVFRLVHHVPPSVEDLATHHETGRLPRADPCLRCGLSVFRTVRDAAHQRQLFQRLGNHIAKATLAPDHGMAKPTRGQQPTHTTWWVYEGVDRAALFTVIAEEG